MQIGLDQEAEERLGLSPADLSSPDFGEAVTIKDGEIPVFWACGVTPQTAVMDAGLPLVITHSPGHMLITDLRDEELLLDYKLRRQGPLEPWYTPVDATSSSPQSLVAPEEARATT